MISAPAALAALSDNYIWTFALPRSGRTVIVDPGDAAPVEHWLAAHGGEIAAILITHHHPDHIGGIRALATNRAIPVIAPDDARIGGATRTVRDGERIDVLLEGVPAQVLEVPGHTRTHIAYVIDGDLLFCGDTLFGAGCGRLFEGTPAQMHRSLARLAALPPTTRVFCGHEYTVANCRFALAVEPDNAALHARHANVADRRQRGEPSLPSTLADELATNPFLRLDAPAVQRYAVARGAAANDPVAVFAALRAAKDTFA
jgi:hydroxyacylglutathione hydrolase